MKATIINGCNGNPLEREALAAVAGFFKSNDDVQVTDLNALTLSPCLGCDTCQLKRPGACVMNDGANELLRLFLRSDFAVIVAPIRFGCFTAAAKNFLDRTEPFVLPCQGRIRHHDMMKNRYAHYPKVLYIGVEEVTVKGDSAKVFAQSVLNCNLSFACKSAAAEVVTSSDDIAGHAVSLASLREVK